MEEATYYAIIPPQVRYDKELSANEKLLYGEITALSSKSGLCWATNKYFSELYGVETRTIRRWIEHLVERGYVYRTVEYNEDEKTVLRRCLSIVPEQDIRQMSWADKNVLPLGAKMSAPSGQKCPHNNINKNNTSIKEKIYKKESEFSEEEVESVKATQTEIPFLIAEESSLSDRVITESEIEEYFKKIYEIYPRKVSKIRAKETFEHKLRGYSSDEGHKIAQKIYKTVKHQAEVWSEENDGAGRRWEMIPHFSTWLNDNVENSPKFRRGKG